MINIKPTEQIVISDWYKGIALSSYLGFEEIRCCDISSKPGVLRVGGNMVKNSGTAISGFPRAMVQNANALYLVDDERKVYTDKTAEWVQITGAKDEAKWNCVIWKDYLIVCGSSSIEAYGPLSGSASWTTLSGVSFAGVGGGRPILLAKNDKIYFGHNFNNLASLEENTGQTFAPGNGNTWTYTQLALDLPIYHNTVAIAELGEKILVATNNSVTGMGVIFPWNMTNTTYSDPIVVGNEKIHSTITVGNRVYILAGEAGNIYYTDGVNLIWQARLPQSVLGHSLTQEVLIEPNAVVFLNNKIYFATSGYGNCAFGAVWSFDPRNKAVNIEKIISTGNTSTAHIGALATYANTAGGRERLAIGWEDGTAQGVDYESSNRRYTSYTAYATSPFYKVGTARKRRSFEYLEAQLAKVLASGEGVQIKYRTSQATTWANATTLATFTTANKQLFTNIEDPTIKMPSEISTIQFQIALTTPANADSTPELLSLIIG